VLADKAVTVTSSADSVEILAQQNIVLHGGDSLIRLEGNAVTFETSGLLSVKGAGHPFEGPGGQAFPLEGLPDSRIKLFDQQMRALDERTGDPIAHLPYKLVTETGDIYYGTTDIEGKTIRLATVNPEKITVFWGASPPYSA